MYQIKNNTKQNKMTWTEEETNELYESCMPLSEKVYFFDDEGMWWVYREDIREKDDHEREWGDLINEKFKDYKQPGFFIRGKTPYLRMMDAYKSLSCPFEKYLLSHYKYHIHGHKQYYKLKKDRAIDTIRRKVRTL